MRKCITLFMVLSLFVVAGCGGSGGGGGTTVAVTGVAAKGPFVSGTVNVYDVSGGIAAKKLLQSGAINSDGSYSVAIPPTSTPVMVEIPAGTDTRYKDEANPGTPKSLTTPLRAILPSVTANTAAAVTPFTELAVQKLSGVTLSKAVIDEANNLVSQLYQVPNIISTMPVDASAAIPAGTATDRVNYGVALAAVSQLTQAASLVDVLSNKMSVATGTLSAANANEFRAAVTTFLAGSNDQTGLDIASTPFVNVGTAVTTTIQASKAAALANGTDSITLTATCSPAVPDNTEITFTLSSGTATFPGGLTTVKARTTNSAATAVVTSSTSGESKITATYVPGSSAEATVKFILPATAVVDVGLKSSFSNVFFLNFKVVATPATGVSGNPVVEVINEAQGLAGNRISPLLDHTNGIASISLVKDTSSGLGFNIVANKPVVRLTYTVVSGSFPQFAASLENLNNPFGLTNPSNPGGAATLQPLAVSDFAVSVTYKDASGNVL